MEISHQRLKEIIMKVISELELDENLNTSDFKKIIYMICLPKWNELYTDFLSEMGNYSNVLVYSVVPKNYIESGYTEKLLNKKACHKIIESENFCSENLNKATIVFPVISLDIITKTALCISDNFFNNLISNCIFSNSEVVFMLNGIPKFSGFEPVAYVNQILEYYKKIISYGIIISNDYEFLSENKIKIDQNINQTFKTQKYKKNVITISNMNEFLVNRTIKINKGDIVTALVKDEARALNIPIIYE